MTEKSLNRTIFRIVKNKDNPYVMMDKRPIENRELSWGAKGMLAYMLSRPDDWEFNVQDLINRSTDGKASVRSIMKELINVGHLLFAGRIMLQTGRGSRAVWNVHEIPQRPRTENQHVVTTTYRLPNSGNQTLTNIENTNIDDDEEKKLSTLSRLYEANIGPITPMVADLLRNASLDFPLPWFEPAVKIAVANNARKWSYVEAILDSWKSNGFGWKPVYKGKNGNGKHKTLEPTELSPDELEAMRQYAEAQFSR